MKVKALLFATAAVVAMTASAGTPLASSKFYAGNVTIENATDKAIIPFYLENPEQPDFTFMQFEVQIPEGFKFVQLSKKEAGQGSNTTMRDGIAAGYAAEAEWTLSSNMETGAFMFGSINNNEIGVTDGEPILYLAIQQVTESGAKIAAGDYECKVVNCMISGSNNDQSLYGSVADSSFTLTIQNGDTPTGVNDINAKAVAGVKYYNLAGVESNVPFDGVNVVVTTYTDGTKAASKVIK